MEQAQVDQGAQRVQEILSTRKIGAPELPPLHLSQTPKPTWIDELMAWLQSFLPKFDGSLDPELAKKIVQIAAGVALALITAAVLLWIYRLKFQKKTKTPSYKTCAVLDPESRILQALKQAIDQKRWSLAARLRWKLFLVRRQLLLSATPSEVDTTKLRSNDFNEAMFKTEIGEKEGYEASDATLDRVEKASP